MTGNITLFIDARDFKPPVWEHEMDFESVSLTPNPWDLTGLAFTPLSLKCQPSRASVNYSDLREFHITLCSSQNVILTHHLTNLLTYLSSSWPVSYLESAPVAQWRHYSIRLYRLSSNVSWFHWLTATFRTVQSTPNTESQLLLSLILTHYIGLL